MEIWVGDEVVERDGMHVHRVFFRRRHIFCAYHVANGNTQLL